jgi:hypothetical protein
MKTLILLIFILVTGTGVVFGAFQSEDPPGTFLVQVQEFYTEGDTISITFETPDTLNIYAFEADVLFEPEWLTYQNGSTLSPHEDALFIADPRGPNHIGIGFAKTTRMDSSWTGSVFTLSFVANEVADSTQTTVRFWNIKGFDHLGNTVDLNLMDPVSFTILNAPDDGGSGGDGGDGGDSNDGFDPDNDPEVVVDKDNERQIVLQYTFDFENVTSSRSLYSNRQKLFYLEGGDFTYVDGLYGVKLLRSTSWADALDKSKYWHTSVNTVHMDTVLLRWMQYGTDSGPRDFHVEYRLDGVNWIKVPNSDYSINSSSSPANSTYIIDVMPMEVAQKENVDFRWVMASDVRIDSSASGISNAGANVMGGISIQGTPEDKTYFEQRLGDTNNDGKTDHTDILPIGMYWRSSGSFFRKPVPSGWVRVSRQRWFPQEAMYADTDANGTINQADLKRVGLYYGYTTLVERAGPDEFTLIKSDGKSLKQQFRVSLAEPTMITGLSGSLRVPGLDPEEYRINITSPVPGILTAEAGALEVLDGVRILDWNRKLDDGYAFAWVDRSVFSMNRKSVVSHLFDVEIERLDGLPIENDLELSGISIVEAGIHLKTNAHVKVESLNPRGPDDGTQLPSEFDLLPAYPNPFNPTTTVTWTLPENMSVKLTLVDMLGREVMVLANGDHQAGYHRMQLNGNMLASGFYLLRLQGNGMQRIRKIALVK